MTSPRVGFGYDVHRLVAGKTLWLGGIAVPSELGADAHSDGDVIIHALMDALLGAAGKRDIGYYFPDNDPALKNTDSKNLLLQTCQIITNAGYTIGNIDITLLLEKPKIKDHIPEMVRTLSSLLQINENDISIKATTGEKMGFVGRSEGIECFAVTLLFKSSNEYI